MTNTNTSAVDTSEAMRNLIFYSNSLLAALDQQTDIYGPVANLMDAVNVANEVLKRPQWRDIADAPKDCEDGLLVFVPGLYQGRGGHFIGVRLRDGFWYAHPKVLKIEPTHWMPLPAPPVSRQQDKV